MIAVGVQTAHWFSFKNADASFERIKKLGFSTVDVGLPGVPVTPEAPTSFYDKPLEEILEIYRPFKEIADITGVSINTALGRMRYAVLNMRRIAAEKRVSLVME